MKNKIFFICLVSKKTILFLTFLLIFSVFSISPKIVLSPIETTLHEETIEIYWDQGVVLNTSMVYNRGEVFLGFSVASYSNSSVLFSFVPATGSCYSVNWTPVIVNEIQLNPGESYSNNHSLKISDRGVGMFIRYFCTILTVDSNATITFTTEVLNFGNKLSSVGFGLVFLISIIVATVYKYSQKKNHLKN